MGEKDRLADKEAKRKKEEKWVLWTLVVCAMTFAGLVVGSAVIFTT
ncbi:hypothetical protein [Salinithrix halophila]|uniref:DUF4044 domain-containing protein n=1 Tax=Salinithrix halophila TaxID=1485204 RepID=A0ABV8JB26_9BACL